MVSQFIAKLVKKEMIANNICIFSFELNSPLTFVSGNYALLSSVVNGVNLSRAFTISSSPSFASLDSIKIEFIIKKVGIFTDYLFNLNIGDSINLKGPFGKIGYDIERYGDKKLIFIAGGTGIALFLSFFNFVSSNSLNTKFKVFYSAKNESTLIHPERILGLNKGLSGYGADDSKGFIFLTAEQKEGYLSGRINKEFLQSHLSQDELNDSIFFLCGPVEMEVAMFQLLSELGARNIVRERG